MQPNQQNRSQTLQVDITKVIEAEAGMYTRMIAELTRQNAVLSIALQDKENETSELHAKLAAATGTSFTASGPGIQFPASAPARSGHTFTAPLGESAEDNVA